MMTRQARFLLSTNSSSTYRSPTVAEQPSTVTVESNFVVILAALLCALISVVGLITMARCAWLRRVNGGGQASSANKGLKKKVLQLLPKFSYEPSYDLGECAICLTEYAVGDEIRMLPQCGHSFHLKCIDTWLGSHSSCPSCRQILVVAPCRKCGEFLSTSDNSPPHQSRSCSASASSSNYLV